MSERFEKLKSRFSNQITEAASFRGDETLVVKKENLLEVAKCLRDEFGFEFLMDLTAADYLPREPRFETVYHFYSFRNNARLRVKCPVPGDRPEIDSLTPLWPAANWFEREAWDMFGINFKGHPDQRRLLMYEEFRGHPLRKDYPLQKRQPRIPHRD